MYFHGMGVKGSFMFSPFSISGGLGNRAEAAEPGDGSLELFQILWDHLDGTLDLLIDHSPDVYFQVVVYGILAISFFQHLLDW